MSRLARLARRVGRKLKALTLTLRAPEPPSLPLSLDVAETMGPATVRDVWCAPAFGVVVDDCGRILGGASRQALRFSPDLSALPGVRVNGGRSRLILPDPAPRLTRGSVLAGWGDLRSYAGFLLNTLPTLLTATKADAPAEPVMLAPPLAAWQVELLGLAGLDRLRTIDAPWVRLDEALLAPPAAPVASHPMLAEVRARIMSALGPAGDVRHRLYISRRDALNAVMADEEEVEIELAARGYSIVRPEASSAKALIDLFRSAEIIVAPTGTALANVLLCAVGARVVEIRPPGATDLWVRDLAAIAGAHWQGFDAAGERHGLAAPLDPALRPASAFEWRADAAALLAFLTRQT